jgi:hypothetical protein
MPSDETTSHPRAPSSGSPEYPPIFWDPRVMRRCWLDALSQLTDGYLRSVVFLELMQSSVQTLVETNALYQLPNSHPQPDTSAPPTSRSMSSDGRRGDAHR